MSLKKGRNHNTVVAVLVIRRWSANRRWSLGRCRSIATTPRPAMRDISDNPGLVSDCEALLTRWTATLCRSASQ